jgi:hypothetical protein
MKKKPASGPELPPGRASFPQMSVIKEMDFVPVSLGLRPVPVPDLHRRKYKHAMRLARVVDLEGMTPAAFKKKYGYKKTLAKIYELVAEAEGGVGPQAIKKSCDLVDAAIEAGNGSQFFVADWPTRKLGKKRPRSR